MSDSSSSSNASSANVKQPKGSHQFPPETTTIGMLGSGQLGRMFAFAAHRLGFRVHVFSPESASPAGRAADFETVADYDDVAALGEFAKQIDVATLEFENIPVASLRILEQHVPVRPGPGVLETTQDRLKEKQALSHAGFPVTEFREICSLAELKSAFDGDTAAILKTASWGYDGKGQSRIQTADDLEPAWETLQCDRAILEAFVDFECELSVIAVRSVTGEVACYDPVRNEHHNHILSRSVSPSGLPEEVIEEAKQIATAIVDSLSVVGVMCVEMFLTRQNRLIINELAPRPHNSGHLTIEAHATSQFEQQVRAVCGMPLGDTRQVRPAAMSNLLGELWEQGQPDFPKIMAMPDTQLHLYGKAAARNGRKMGHLTTLGESVMEAAAKADQAMKILRGNGVDGSENAGAPNDRPQDRQSTAKTVS